VHESGGNQTALAVRQPHDIPAAYASQSALGQAALPSQHSIGLWRRHCMYPRTAPRLTCSDLESLYRAPQPHDSRRICASQRLQPPSTDDELLAERKHHYDDNLDALHVQ
jgi:hypothetical protein